MRQSANMRQRDKFRVNRQTVAEIIMAIFDFS